MSKKPKNVTLRAFSIKENGSVTSSGKVLKLLREKLLESSTAKERCMLLSAEDPNQEKDLISNFEEASNPENIFCTMLRIAPGEDSQHITSDLLEKPSFALDDLQNIYNQGDISIPAICKEHYYFSINDDHLVTNLRAGKTAKDLQIYLAWIMQDDLFELYPLTELPEGISLKDIRNITFSGGSLGYNDNSASEGKPESDTKSIKLNKLAMAVITKLLSDTKELSQHDLERHITAELVLKIKKPNASEKENFQKTMGAILMPVADLENIAIRPKKGKTITGKELAKEKIVEISVTESGKLVEQALRQEMSKFINELKNG